MSTARGAPAVTEVAEGSRRSARVVGVDIARCVALVGMMSTHVLPGIDLATGSFVPWHQQLAGGRSAALFAVLAGVSLALVTGRERPYEGRRMTAARVGIAVRAGVIALIGLAISGLDSGIAVILTYYGVLFLLGLPFLRLPWKVLAGLAIGWAVVAPVISHLVRPHLPVSLGQASLERLVVEPHLVLTELVLTGYYPAFSWLAYLLAGLAVGRLALGRLDVARNLLIGGGALALVAWGVSKMITADDAVMAILRSSLPGSRPEARLPSFDVALVHGFWGTTSTESWWWLTVAAPHSSTPFDLLHTIGTSVLVIGACLLVGHLAPRALSVVFGAGAMTLTLYTCHVLALAAGIGPDRGPALFRWHAVGALLLGALLRATLGKGPLEWLIASIARGASEVVLAARVREPAAVGRGGPGDRDRR